MRHTIAIFSIFFSLFYPFLLIAQQSTTNNNTSVGDMLNMVKEQEIKDQQAGISTEEQLASPMERKKSKKEPKSKKKVKENKKSKNTPETLTKKEAMNGSRIRLVEILSGADDDFSPIAYQNGIVFCSNSKKKKKTKQDEDLPSDLNLKFSAIDSLTGQLSKPTLFARGLNTKGNEGPSAFAKGDSVMYLTANNPDKKGKINLKIYIKRIDSTGTWSGKELLPFELETYQYCHPAVSADGQRLYFSSNIPGGLGGMDIYYSRRMGDTAWSQPINMGSRVNSAGNELFPQVSPDGQLYFSSNGWNKGLGGLDIYHMNPADRTVSRPLPLATPFNSEGDDFGLMFIDAQHGFLSSNRKTEKNIGGDNIFEFQIR